MDQEPKTEQLGDLVPNMTGVLREVPGEIITIEIPETQPEVLRQILILLNKLNYPYKSKHVEKMLDVEFTE